VRFQKQRSYFAPMEYRYLVLLHLELKCICCERFPFGYLTVRLAISLCSHLFPLLITVLSTVPYSLITFGYLSDYFPKNPIGVLEFEDRKSTRLNSSHVKISYAVF